MRHVLNYIKTNKLLSATILLGFFFHMLIIIPSGTYMCFGKACGIQFWGVHGHDTIWHLALANAAFRHIPFVSPIYSGALLSGYNFLLDLIAFLISKQGVSLLFVYFKLFPLLWFVLFTFVLIKMGKKLHNSSLFLSILLFFAYFGGSFAFLFTLYHKGGLQGASGMLAMQSLLTLTNLQYAFSLICVLVVIYLFNMEKPSFKRELAIGLMIFIAFGLKFYAGIIVLFYAGIYALCDMIKHKNGFVKYIRSQIIFYVIILISVTSSVLFFYNPFSSLKSGFPLIFSPFAIVHSMIEDPSLFYLRDMTNARYFLYSKGFGPRLMGIELFSTFLFIFFNLGSRVFGILYVLWKLVKKKMNMFVLTTLLTIMFSFCLSILFIQKGEWWNTIQFSYFGIFLANIFIAELIYALLRKKNFILMFLALMLILLNIPENIDVVKGFYPLLPSTYVSVQELKALNVLERQPEGTVYVPIFGYTANPANNTQNSSPGSLYTVLDSAYVTAFTGKQSFLTDIHVLNITGVAYGKRLKRIAANNCNLLKQAAYIYYPQTVPDAYLNACSKYIQTHFRTIYDQDGFQIEASQKK